MSKQIRWTMSLRQRDVELTEYFSLFSAGDRSAECRKLMYLGLELLEMRANGMEPTSETSQDAKVRPLRSSNSPTPEDEMELLNKRLDAL